MTTASRVGIALGIVIAVAAAMLVTTVLTRAPGSRRPRLERARLEAAARGLAATRPDLFRDFAPLTYWECRAPDAAAIRAARSFVLLRPSGVVLAPPPAYVWERTGAARAATLRVVTGDGTVVWRSAVKGSPFRPADPGPACTPGRTYVWRLAGEVERDDDPGLAFSVATAAGRRAFETAVRAIRAAAPEAADLLIAHWAIRRDMYAEAERAVAAFRADHGDHALARELSAYLAARVGSAFSGSW